MPLFQIDLNLLPMKLHYFLWNAGIAPIVPFVPTFAKQLGVSAATVGTIYMFLPLFGLLSKPIFGAISDRYKIQKCLFLCSIFLTAGTFYVILYLPNEMEAPRVELNCGEGRSEFKYCSKSDKCGRQSIIEQSMHQRNVSFVCEIVCQTKDPAFINELCQSWKVPHFCPTPSPLPVPKSSIHSVNAIMSHNFQKKFDPSQIGKYHITSLESLGGNNDTLSQKKLNLTEVRFRSYVSAYHILEINSCLYFEISHIHFNFEKKTSEHVPVCKVPIDVAKCQVMCDSPDIMSYLSNEQDSSFTSHYQFWLFVFLLICSWVGMAVVTSLGDTICFELLGNEPQKYGKQRLWGAVGWGIFSLLAGFLVDHFSSSSFNKNYTPVFYLTLMLLLFDVFVSSKIKNVQTSMSPNIFKDVSKLLVEPRIVVFLVWCTAVGVCTAMLWQYLFWFLEDLESAHDCDHSTWMKTLQGLGMLVQCFGGELPFFFFSGWFLRKVGHVNSMTLVLAGFGVRFYLYSILSNPWWSVPIELFNGITFGLFWPCMTSYANVIAPPGTEATIQGLVGAFFEGVGVSLGSLVGGYIYTAKGGVFTFQLFSAFALVLGVLHHVGHYMLRVKTANSNVKGINQRTRYASPTEAIHMLDDVTT